MRNKPGRVATGVMVALFGPDGSGKTAVADTLENQLRSSGYQTIRYHWRPRILSFKKHQELARFRIEHPDDFPSRSIVISIGLFIFYFTDFFLAYYFELRPLLQKGYFIIYERYFYDCIFHPGRYRLRNLKHLSYFLSKLLPSPDHIVLLKGNPDTIRGRKDELSIAEITRQINDMTEVLPKMGKYTSIDVTEISPIEVSDKIYDQIL